MPQTIRKYWGRLQGKARLNYNWDAIKHDSTVIITASEYIRTDPVRNDFRFTGDASITVENIAPHGPPFDPNHGVTFIVNVDWGEPLFIATDITVLDNIPAEIDYFIPPIPVNVGLRMQYQECTEWCWIAVGTSIYHFYNPSSSLKQCELMTRIGNVVNNYVGNGCPTASAIAAVGGLAAQIADPYNISALFAFNNPALVMDQRFLKSGGVTDALKYAGNGGTLGGLRGANTSLSDITNELNAARPVIASIQWNAPSSGSHEVVIAGVFGEYLLILDPVNGQSVIPFSSFAGGYFGGATVINYVFTQPGS